MGTLTVRALRSVLGALFAGTVFVQAVLVPLMAMEPDDFDGELAHVRVLVLVLAFLGMVTVQVVLYCVWRLATMVRRGTVFSHAAFRYVDGVIRAFAAAAVLVFVLAVALAPGEAVPPGGVLLLGGVGLAVLGVALIVLVLRVLLAQAVARDVEATQLRAELDEVI